MCDLKCALYIKSLLVHCLVVIFNRFDSCNSSPVQVQQQDLPDRRDRLGQEADRRVRGEERGEAELLEVLRDKVQQEDQRPQAAPPHLHAQGRFL